MLGRFDEEKLAAMVKQLEYKYLAANKLPNLQIAITTPQETIYSHVSGFADIATKTPITTDHSYRIYSMTKPITCMALMMLVERGLIQLSDPVADYLPELASLKVYEGGTLGDFSTRPIKAPLTIHQLLTHTSGLTYGFNQGNPIEQFYVQNELDHVWRNPKEQWLASLAEAPLLFEPGSAWNYGLSTDVIGFVVEAVSGETLGEFMQREIFQPLGMSHTGFQYTGPTGRMTSCYQYTDEDPLKLFDHYDNSLFSQTPRAHSGGGGLVSTSADYLKFMRMLLNNGRHESFQIIAPKTLEYMRLNHLPNGASIADMSIGSFSEVRYQGTGYGLGFSSLFDVTASGVVGSEGEYGWGGMASTNFWIDPEEQFGVLLLTQLIPSSTYNIRSDLRSMIYGCYRY
ncbi:serine hydrolase domain-containing protein [Umboniibacter marinipuniceus]|uniref:CubicO group peptidase (Beta-lactamase class C family) n=1 Tax=Umboniibacter marinipuniceus TaxID=569599 RepID=A0A3M0AHP1_9GAMM|nr:serine hydrolase domain-containing protein [Umboniibacter marinipuniceus]RMA82085.1 CubicO group peptidase (beta-lactamase class C family) [Umboniibacter marinipuniceus]